MRFTSNLLYPELSLGLIFWSVFPQIFVEKVWTQLIWHPSYCIVIVSAIVLYLVLGRAIKGRESLRLDDSGRDRLAFPDLTDRELTLAILLLLCALTPIVLSNLSPPPRVPAFLQLQHSVNHEPFSKQP